MYIFKKIIIVNQQIITARPGQQYKSPFHTTVVVSSNSTRVYPWVLGSSSDRIRDLHAPTSLGALFAASESPNVRHSSTIKIHLLYSYSQTNSNTKFSTAVYTCHHVCAATHMRVVHCSIEYMYTHRRPPVGTKGDPRKIGTADWTPRETLE